MDEDNQFKYPFKTEKKVNFHWTFPLPLKSFTSERQDFCTSPLNEDRIRTWPSQMLNSNPVFPSIRTFPLPTISGESNLCNDNKWISNFQCNPSDITCHFDLSITSVKKIDYDATAQVVLWMEGYEGKMILTKRDKISSVFHDVAWFSWRGKFPFQDYSENNDSIPKLNIEFTIFLKDESKLLSWLDNRVSEKLNDADITHGLDYEHLLESEKFSDVTIVTKGIEFKVHKAILSARSKVFSAMFDSDMKEHKENKVEINDIDADTMRELLRFIYAGKVRDIKKIACDLIIPADKYEINGLRTVCEKTLIDNISIDNIQSILVFCDRIELSFLKEKAFQFLMNHRYLLETEEFLNFMQTLSSAMLTDIIVKLISRFL